MSDKLCQCACPESGHSAGTGLCYKCDDCNQFREAKESTRTKAVGGATEKHRVVCGLLKNKAGQYFIGLRFNNVKYPSTWEFPGGKVEPGETDLQALKREWKEETGFDISSQLEPMFTFNFTDTTVVMFFHVWLTNPQQKRNIAPAHVRFAWQTQKDMKRLNLIDNYGMMEAIERDRAFLPGADFHFVDDGQRPTMPGAPSPFNKESIEYHREKQNPFHDLLKSICSEMGPFLVSKNEKYGDAARRATRIMQIIFPDGIPFERMGDAYYIEQVVNKICRVASDHEQEDEDPWRDAAGYSLLASAERELEKRRRTQS